ncbi:MAG: hypothetical protein Q4B26_13930 [Eubacteriales bacterium]|nr:hypothetical protein [Eubacteriales bacterium]
MDHNFNRIGIEDALDWKRIRKLFIIGFVAALMVLVGDMLLGYGVDDETLSGLERSFSRFIARSDRTLFWSSLLGVIGIPLECLCYFGIYRLMTEHSPGHAHAFRSGIIGCLIFGGCGVHMPCLAIVYVYKHMMEAAPEYAFDTMLQFGMYFLLPGMIMFLISWIVLCTVQISAFVRGYTPYPRWCWVFSLPLPMLVIQIMRLLIGNHAVMYAISAGWISVGNLWMFGGLLVMMKKAQKGSKSK